MTRKVGIAYPRHSLTDLNVVFTLGGFTKNPDSVPEPDWVDDTVAGWIEEQVAMMNAAWGPADQARGSLAFVHIPP